MGGLSFGGFIAKLVGGVAFIYLLILIFTSGILTSFTFRNSQIWMIIIGLIVAWLILKK